MNEPKFITQPLTMSDGSTGTITFDGVKGITTPHTPGDGFKLRFANPVSNYNLFTANMVRIWISGVDPYRLEPDPQPDPQTVKKFEDLDRQVSDSFGDMLKD